MIPRKVIEQAGVGYFVLYRGDAPTWYSGIVKNVKKYGDRPVSETVGFLDVDPIDMRLSGSTRRLWDSTGQVYLVPKEVLTGKMSDEQVRILLDSGTFDPIERFYVDEIMESLHELRKNYREN